MAEHKKLAIIDGKSVFYRGYYAMPNLSTNDGKPTGGVFGFATMALEVLRRLKPDYVCVAWDKPKTNIRKRLKLYPEYKAGRKPAPPDFYEQVPILHELLQAFGWPLYELDDYEADDIMGTLALQATKKGIETQLVTSDLDMLQLVHPLVHVYALKKGLSNIELFRPETFILKYGITPEQFLDLKALKGDSSDNIPGVPGIGEKGAIELLKEFKTLDGVYDNLELTKESTRKKLEAGKDLAYLSKKLGAIWTDAPIKLNLKEVDGSKANPEEIRDILQRLEFRSLVRQLPEIMKVQEPADDHSSFKPDNLGQNVYINSADKLKQLDLSGSDKVFVHSRTAGKHGKDPLVIALSVEPKKRVFIIDLASIDHQAAAQTLKTALKDKSLIGYDVKSTLQLFIELDLDMPPVEHDVQIGSFLLNSLRREQNLTELAQVEIGYEGAGFEELDGTELIGLEPEIISVINSLYKKQTEELKVIPKLAKLAKDIEWPVIPVIADMEKEGIRLDGGYLEIMGEQLADQISDIEQKVYGHANQEFNISSPVQLADILFNKLNLDTKSIKKGKTGYSTAATELDKLRESHPIINLITEYREYTKLKNTYVDTLPQQIDENSRVHTTYDIAVAPTGRLSSNDPNLQNIPVRTELGKQIRTAFVASPGKMLVSADYNQFELRLAAYLANDEELIKMFNDGVDVHTMTAAQVYNRDPDEVTKQMRRDAKVINFGVIYGMSPHGLSVATGMTMAAAKAFIDKYFELRKPLLDYMKHLREKAEKDGYVETLFGRRRPTPDIHSSNFMVREAAYRQAINMPIQGTEADLMKMAMIDVYKKLQSDDCKILLQIHDSLIVECPEDKAEDTAKMLKETMEAVYKLPVKLDVDASTGKNWGEL
ncbi:MAG TPA: DNA polymerase I [Candidatus Saccharimonadales bacterium]|nr:DNA polymerase I [Candidatus Saccharimonadales bacterium]